MSIASPISNTFVESKPLVDINSKRKIDNVLDQEEVDEENAETKIEKNAINKEERGLVEQKRPRLDTTKWVPPSVSRISNLQDFKTTTYMSEIPQQILNNPQAPVVLGVDEAGRGPVLGPMVYGVAYSLQDFSKNLQKDYGFADSKQLTDDKRQYLFQLIEDENGNRQELNRNVGWATTTMTAKDIASGMLRPTFYGKGVYNLNEQAHNTTIDLITRVIKSGVNVTAIFVDTVGPPATYQAKLKKLFPTVDITVAKKADSIYPIVSTASVVAKVTRDLNLQHCNESLKILKGHTLGSGYPSDPNTTRWLNSNVDPIFGWCFGLIRFSWQTAKDCLEKQNAIDVIYQDDCVKNNNKGYKDVSEMMNTHNNNEIRGRICKAHYNSDHVDL